MLLHFGDMLVVQIKAVGAKADICAVTAFEPFNQCFAAARIARHRVDAVGPVCGDQSGSDQGCDQPQKAGGVATGVADEPRIGNPVVLAGAIFGEAISPVGVHTMRSRCVDDARVARRRHCHRLFCGIVGQAQDDKVRVVQCLAFCSGVFAFVIIKRDQRKFRAASEPVRDFKASGA